jgi:hypothetical protein
MENSSMRTDFRAVIGLIALFFLLGKPAPAQEPKREIQLTAPLIEAYLLTQPAVMAIQLKVWKGEVKANDPGFIADVERTAKMYGLRDEAEFSAVLNTIIPILNEIDPRTKALTHPDDALKKGPVHQANADLVVKYYVQIYLVINGQYP